ncbi:hypothetical protein ACOSQ2_021229 [Xanthoceras sorbifolium]
MRKEQEARVDVGIQVDLGVSILKRARADLGVEDRGKPPSMNFNSTLSSMTSPQYWEGLGKANKNMTSHKNNRHEGKTDRGIMEGPKIKDNKRTDGEGRNYPKGVLHNKDCTGAEEHTAQKNSNQKAALFDITNSKLKNKNYLGSLVKNSGEKSKDQTTNKGQMTARLKGKLSADTTALDKKIREHFKHPGKFPNPSKGVVSKVK